MMEALHPVTHYSIFTSFRKPSQKKHPALGLTSKLHLSPSGLDFFQLGLHAATPWSNMETLTVAQVGPARITVVRLRQPARIVWVWHPAGYRERVLQLPFNGYDLGEKSALRVAIQHYAPHLLD